MLNEYSEKYLLNFVRDLISDTKQGDIEWSVDYDIRNNRHLKVCTSDDKQIKITGVYDKAELEKVSFLITKSITINYKNPTLLNKFRELILLIDDKQELKLDLPDEITDYIKGYYEKTNKTGTYIKPGKSQNTKSANSKKESNNKQNSSHIKEEIPPEEFEVVEESGVEIKVRKDS